MMEWLRRMLGGAGASPDEEDDPLEGAAPFELVKVRGRDAQSAWEQLRRREGFHPVLLGDREAAEGALEVRSLNGDEPQALLAAGLALDIERWLEARVAEDPAQLQADWSVSGDVEAAGAFSSATDVLTGKPHAWVYFALVPAREPWEVAAQLKPGAWNDCPEPAAHVAFFKRWFDRYGAVVTAITNETIEFTVARPPIDPRQARELAWEHFVYCPDAVHQGADTVGNLAASLEGNRHWYFWWD